jgi:aromatic-amino-acid transaminase
MLSNLAPQPADALLALIKLYAADNRSDKIDLGVGVYRTGQGGTPVFGAIKAAEQRLIDTQDSKSYLRACRLPAALAECGWRWRWR